MLGRFLSEYGMLLVLAALCAALSAVTYTEQAPGGADGGAAAAQDAVRATSHGERVLVVTQGGQDAGEFSAAAVATLEEAGRLVAADVSGSPADALRTVKQLNTRGAPIAAVVATAEAGSWGALEDLGGRFPAFRGARLFVPQSYRWPSFLNASNLVNVLDQMAVIAILAIGMTAVIIAGGIDLSVGSLLALTAVIAAVLIRDVAGGSLASPLGMALCCLAAIGAGGLVGLANGALATYFHVPAFIVTLGMMLIARGLAYRVSGGQSVSDVPADFAWLSRGTPIAGLPNAILLMLLLYALAHVVMSRTTLGRYLYAVGGNAEAARLSGVPVRRVILLAYALNGLLAGLGGVLLASVFRSAAPNYGENYELSVIAAVVVGGTSLHGGEGKMLGTLVGALLIAVIQNGMNLLNLETSSTQRVVLGGVIIAAVLVDRLRHHVWRGTAPGS